MGENYLLNHPWLPTLIWVVLSLGDYYLTIIGARLAKKQHIIEYEGSYELNPVYQDDIDKLKLYSPRMIKSIIIMLPIYLFMGYIPGVPRYLFGLLIGATSFADLPIYIRHINNIVTFRSYARVDSGISGNIKLPERRSYYTSYLEFICFSLFTFTAFVLTGSPILLGGSLGMAGMALGNFQLSRKKPGKKAEPPPLK